MGMGEVVDVIEITVTACFYIGGLLLLLNCGGLVEAFEPTTVTPLTAPSAVSPFSAALALQLRQRGGQSGGRRSERHRGQALAAADSGGDDLGEKYSNPLTALVGQFLPSGDAPSSSSSSSSSPNDDAFAAIDWDAPKAQGGIGSGLFPISFDAIAAGKKPKPLAAAELRRRLEEGLRAREWFVTGLVLPELFEAGDGFLFKDPDVELRGIKEYAEGVRRIFDQKTSRALVASVELDSPSSPEPIEGCSSVITVEWRLSGRVNVGGPWLFGGRGVPIKPYMITTHLHVGTASGLVRFQEDVFSIPSWDILLSALAPWLPLPFANPAPAPPQPPQPPPSPQKLALPQFFSSPPSSYSAALAAGSAERSEEDVPVPSRSSSSASLYSSSSSSSPSSSSVQRPLLDQVATTLFKLETGRVAASSEVDESGRVGEPMEWAESGSLANKLSEAMASGPGYAFKQAVADLVAGGADFDAEAAAAVGETLDAHVASSRVAMFSFTTCPFCRKAKDLLDEKGIPYAALELDERDDGNQLRAVLGRRTKRTSVPSIFIDGVYIGGMNDGSPGLGPLAESGELEAMLLSGAGAAAK